MSKIKNLVFSAMLILGAFGAVTFTSCSKEDETCGVGYEGKDCATETRAKFVGSWSASELVSGSSTPLVYNVTIANGSSVTDVIISKSFSDDFFNNNITATVSNDANGMSMITIPDQRPDANGDYRVAGSGNYNTNGTLTWSYTITEISTGDRQTVTGTWTK